MVQIHASASLTRATRRKSSTLFFLVSPISSIIQRSDVLMVFLSNLRAAAEDVLTVKLLLKAKAVDEPV